MTRFEAIRDAIDHRNRGHVPYAINLSGEGGDKYAQRLIDDYANEQVLADYKAGRLGRTDACSLAIGNCMINVGCPWWNWHSYPEDYSAEDTPTKMPFTVGYGSYEGSFNYYKFLKENYDVYVLVTIFGSHFEKAYFSRGIENLLADIAGSPEFVDELCRLIIRKNIVMLENILTCPYIDGVLLGSDWGSQKDLIMSPQSWRTLIKDGEKQEYDLVKSYGKDIFVHSCGKIDRIIPDLYEMGLQVLNPVQPECMDIFELKRLYGDKLAFWGGIGTQRILPYGTADEVVAESTHIIEEMSRDGGYITSPSQDILAEVPYENLTALIETAKTHLAL